MPPELIATIGFFLIAFGLEAQLDWVLSGDKPLVIGRMGLIGELLEQLAFWIVALGGVSIVVWSFVKLPWYFPIVLLIVILTAVKVVSRPIALRKWLTSALVPPAAATGVLVLQWFTWFA